ncbi:MAG TPA: hypothetical protein VN721_16710 [Flavipsychrobacter sp.]|nr:hypothetical protein [Flavipsychrobacter sp.]
MRKFDFSQPGGFPLTQDTLDWLQTAYTETILALAAIGGSGPFIVSGFTATGWTVAPGWIFYNGELLYFVGWLGPLPPFLPPGSPEKLCMIIVETDTPLTFNDGSTPSVKQIRQLTLGNAVPTVGSSFAWSGNEMPTFVKETAFGSLDVIAGTGTTTGQIFYKKNTLNNTLQIRAVLTVTDPSSLASVSTNPPFILIATLPAGYRPNNSVPFTGYVSINLFKDDAGVDFIKQVNGDIGTDGRINIGLLKSDASISNYEFYFNCIIPLD